ncbi:hypothetical protein Y032_0304g1930 [Ancylostoma ceylanicum]|uniref:Uncharacterized protein n=1 Tax=Ancylostoma ceylanicum TaxID=53326 RepID=A0A016S3C6_9BILA|nr:hypothetical protein Y032_0304g1930 [Ancylostoma ceylanicum]
MSVSNAPKQKITALSNSSPCVTFCGNQYPLLYLNLGKSDVTSGLPRPLHVSFQCENRAATVRCSGVDPTARVAAPRKALHSDHMRVYIGRVSFVRPMPYFTATLSLLPFTTETSHATVPTPARNPTQTV